jgi:hypothetical protein
MRETGMGSGASYDERMRRARPYSYAMLAVWFLPGLALSLVRDMQLFPASIVRLLHPCSILPWEKAFVVNVLGRFQAGGVTAADLSHPSSLNEQSVVLAFVSFFLVFLVFGLQTLRGALFTDYPITVFPTALAMLPVAILLRCFALQMLFEDAKFKVPRAPTGELVSQVGHFLAPWWLTVSTCLLALTVYAIGRIAYLHFTGRYAS